ncbi:hypothetical protein MNV49_007743 [Pseudohyphozyma bogoriensis]|nr:hypothetical protein MNV49_007743 [Pseudohyphozyma bogoriensis]
MLLLAPLSLGLVSSALASPFSLPKPIQARDTANSSSAPTVTVKNGTLQGRSEPGLDQELFLNIPYAQAPVGDLRLANPQPVNTTFNGTYDASSWGNVCPGIGISSTSNTSLGQPYNLNEDCLNIGIIRPAGTKEGDNLPVLYWIFGGGFIQGTANDPRYNGSYLVQRSVEQGQPIIFASVNYRLAGFGFPAGDAAAAAGVLNLGLKDQRLGLHWLQENIAAFGGSPDKVTIWGQSAGGISVVHQMTAYAGRDDRLFRGAVIDSGVFANMNSSLASQAPLWNKLMNATSCTGSDQLACLRALPYDTYYAAIVNSSYNPAPVPDGDFMLTSNVAAILNGKIVQKPSIVGCVHDEATSGIGAPIGLQTDAAFRTALTTAFANVNHAGNSTIDALVDVYPNDPEVGCPYNTGDGVLGTGLQDKRINAVYTDNIHAGARLFGRKHSAIAPTWSFRFDQVPQNNTIDAGVAHANELPYIFGVMNRTVRTPLGNRPGDLATSKDIQTAFINFVNNQNPNTGADISVSWPTYDKNDENVSFKNNATAVQKDDYRAESIEHLIKLVS